MYLKKLELKNYRNYHHINLNFDKNTVLILGNNGDGKTNLLESIHYLSTGRSHRTYTQDEIINWASSYSFIKAIVDSGENDGLEHFIEIELRKDNNTRIRVDKINRRKKTDFISMLPSVIFSPDDMRIVKYGPSERRNFLDGVLEKTDRSYYRQRLQYQKILAHRTSLIKSIGGKIDTGINSSLEVWNDNLVKYGTDIMKKRFRLINEIKSEFKNYMKSFFKEASADIFYVFSWDRESAPDSLLDFTEREARDGDSSMIKNLEETFGRKLKDSIERDLQYKNTRVGPHRDDFVILLGGKNVRCFGSQGQQRIASISLKLCEMDVLRKKIKRDPVLLLDDVFSELDIERKKILVRAVKNKFQTFVTTTNMSYLDKIDLEFGSRLLVKDNKVTVLDL